MSTRSLIAIVLASLLMAPTGLFAQQLPGQPAAPPQAVTTTQQSPPPAPSRRQLAPGNVRILVLEGNNAINSVTAKSAISPVIQVLDALEQPVEGADVTFEAPTVGAGGTFGAQPIATTRTDFSGQATATFTPNGTPGTFFIKVKVSIAGQTVVAQIRQTNDRHSTEAMLPTPPTPWYKNWKWWAVIGAGAGVGIGSWVYFYNRGNTSTITIAPGTVTIGGPR